MSLKKGGGDHGTKEQDFSFYGEAVIAEGPIWKLPGRIMIRFDPVVNSFFPGDMIRDDATKVIDDCYWQATDVDADDRSCLFDS